MKKINVVGVIGAGTMGAAIAQKFAQEGFKVYLNDREIKYVDKAIAGIREILNEGVTRGIFQPQKVNEIIDRIIPIVDQLELKKCDLIVEAIFEDFEVKSNLFRKLSEIVPESTILATNTSSFSVTDLAKSVKNPARFIGLHYFYHAAKNRLVEIIPGAKTSAETYKSAQIFSVLSGKDAITTKDNYGFAVNRFFVPWLNESVKMLDEGIGTIEEIDAVCMKVFGIGMGPFALMNATGVPIAMHAQRTLEHFGPSYKVASRLEQQVSTGLNWTVNIPENFQISEAKSLVISERILGCTFFVCSQILNENVCSPTDLNRGAKIGLRWRKGPVDLLIQMGEKKAIELVTNYARIYGEKIPSGIIAANWKMEFVTLSVENKTATITMSRPEDMNALNEEVMKQLDVKFSEAEKLSDIETIVLTGSGKAFVAGADIKFFVQNIKAAKIENIVDFTAYGQQVFDKIDHSRKKVVAIFNGLALGGGLELALCADVLLSLPKSKFSFPETGIGIYPGLGGTQRAAKKLGKGLAKYLILTGKMIGAKEAQEIGLIDGIIQADEMFEIQAGNTKAEHFIQRPAMSSSWKSIDKLFSSVNYQHIIAGDTNGVELDADSKRKLSDTLKSKAPVAMRISDTLIEEARGNSSELEKLRDIFGTKDALLGLTSIGKKVEYSGQ